MGWDVLATDLPDVIASVLSANITNNLHNLPPQCGTIQVRALDWTVPPSEWTWDNETVIASHSARAVQGSSEARDILLTPPFDLIITADTVYSPALVQPLLRTLMHVCLLSRSHDTGVPGTRKLSVYICIERRDPALTEDFLASAKEMFSLSRVPHRKLADAMEGSGLRWAKDDWEGMEIWSFTPISDYSSAHMTTQVK